MFSKQVFFCMFVWNELTVANSQPPVFIVISSSLCIHK